MVLFVQVSSIPSDYASIRGTVNEVATIFVADAVVSNLCMANVEPANEYIVELQFYDANGEVLAEYSDTLTQAENSFIFDRTQEDIDYIKNLTPTQRASITSDLKGALNTSDFERLLANIKTVAFLDNASITNPELPNIPDADFFTDVHTNLGTITFYSYKVRTTPNLPNTPWNSFTHWNDIEQILHDNYDIRTTRFKYFGSVSEMPMREATEIDNVVIEIGGKVYKTPATNIISVASSAWQAFISQYNFTEVTE